MYKKILTILSSIIFILLISAVYVLFKDTDEMAETQTPSVSIIQAESENVSIHEDEKDYLWDDSDTVSIRLNTNSISSEDKASLTVKGTTLTITSAGTYSISGTLDDGQIIVDTKDKELVRIILDGVDISNFESSPVYVKNAEKVIIILGENSQNYLSDEKNYVFDGTEEEPNATLFSKADLTIYSQSNGSLNVTANYNDAISSKDGLIIKNAKISLTAEDDGIRGKDYLVIENSDITVKAESNGLKSDNDTEASMGYVSIKDSNINITAGGDAITGQTDVIISGSNFNLSSGGGSSYSVSQDLSQKAIKGLVSIMIESGNFVINSADDALHSNENIVINGGTFDISSGDDGMHADSSIEINGGSININKSFEGIESAIITINGGDIYIVSSDDGINVAGGNDGSGMGGRPGQGGFNQNSGNYYLYINGGYIYMNANGDGLDSNGSIEMTGGTVIVNGPTRSDNGALDYNATFNISGGFLLAVGSSGMAMSPSQSSTQYSALINFSSSQQAGSMINIQSESGENILTFSPAKQYQSVLLSSADIKNNETYLVYLGGSCTDTQKNGLYENGTYTPGTQNTSFTVSSIITTTGVQGMNGGGMMPGGGMQRGMQDMMQEGMEWEMPTDMPTDIRRR